MNRFRILWVQISLPTSSSCSVIQKEKGDHKISHFNIRKNIQYAHVIPGVCVVFLTPLWIPKSKDAGIRKLWRPFQPPKATGALL